MLERPSKLISYRFDQLADQINKRVMPDEADVDRYVGLEHLDPDSLRIRRWGDTSEVESTKLLFKPGDIIFGKRRVYQRKVAVADFEGICSAHAMVLRAKPETVLPEFLPFFMQSDLFMERALSISVGSLSPTINWKALAKEEFLLPPIQEQARLVEVCLSLEDNLNSLYSAKDSAEQLLRAVLFKEIPLAAKGDLGKKKARRFGDYVEIIDPNPSHRYPEYCEEGFPLVATQDFAGADGYDYSQAKHVPETTFLEQKRRCRFEPKDVVFARKGILGLSRFYGEKDKAFSHTIVIMKPKDDLISRDFLLWVTRSDSFMAEISRGMNANSGVPTLGVESLSSALVALPDREKQDELAKQFIALNDGIKDIERRRNEIQNLKTRIVSGIADRE